LANAFKSSSLNDSEVELLPELELPSDPNVLVPARTSFKMSDMPSELLDVLVEVLSLDVPLSDALFIVPVPVLLVVSKESIVLPFL
jgi:hypothetical protein